MTRFRIQSRGAGKKPRIRRDRRRDWHCAFELLEPLQMLDAVNWIGPASGGTWNTALYWSDTTTGMNHVPGATDNVTISGNVTVMHGSGADQINSLTIGTGATLDINGGSTITLEVSSGTAVTDDGTMNVGDATTAGNLLFNGNQTLGVTSGDTGMVVLGGNSGTTRWRRRPVERH